MVAAVEATQQYGFESKAGERGGERRGAAILAIVGVINLPIIKYSVEWWNTLHQPASVIRMDGPTIDPEFLWPLIVMAVAFTLLFFTLHILAMRNEILRRRIAVLRRHAARAAGDAA